jgi:hypothetical protein
MRSSPLPSSQPHDTVATGGVAHGSPYDILLGEVDRVLGEWRQLVATEPWNTLPHTRLIDSFPEVLPKLFRLARAGATELDVEVRELVAAAHGTPRRQDGLPLRAVADEWTLLQLACWTVLRRNGVPEDAARSVLSRLDLLIDDAIGVTLRGYYAPELDALRGRGLERRSGDEDRRSGETDRRD